MLPLEVESDQGMVVVRIKFDGSHIVMAEMTPEQAWAFSTMVMDAADVADAA